MDEFIAGQRWVNHAELELGLGIVVSRDHRTVTLAFQSIGEQRTYAKANAPLTRARFVDGDVVRSEDGHELVIAATSEQDGIIVYHGRGPDGAEVTLPEVHLDHSITLKRPAQRLLSGQIDPAIWLELRLETREHLDRARQSSLHGLVGARTSLLAHQLYVAHEVARRHAPRVLLADEVGLGKTIEAGLIVHQLLTAERIGRVLIAVPQSLTHQWLVEMLRRFNLHFSIFDAERLAATSGEGSESDDNPFLDAQLVLCSHEFLIANEHAGEQAAAAGFDIAVIDEAHHLEWSPEEASPLYRTVARIAERTPALLLLTATPEQLGKAGHFGRLKLLDPDRYQEFEAFLTEERRYGSVARDVTEVLESPLTGEPDDAPVWSTLEALLGAAEMDRWRESLNEADETEAERLRHSLIDTLIDRHGTGRVMFRNTRANVGGFAERKLTTYPLEPPPAYGNALTDVASTSEPGTAARRLAPERAYERTRSNDSDDWTLIDPRVAWLMATLAELRPAKVLVIAAHAETVLDLARSLRVRRGIHAAVFHEDTTLIERDRAAAFFADEDSGAQTLICSEIGSEGRNFQFAHHLVLFDLPAHPDLLEQRIGRLDRIGQTETVRIHVPFLTGTAQASMLAWYHEGLDAFEHTCAAGAAVHAEFATELVEVLATGNGETQLVARTRAARDTMMTELCDGRDRLLELGSCRQPLADDLLEAAETLASFASFGAYMERVFDCLGVQLEEGIGARHVLRTGEGMRATLPGLSEEGLAFTYDRNTALAREDLAFLTLEHPLVVTAMDALFGAETGNTAMIALRCDDFEPGTLLLEASYVLEVPAGTGLDTTRFLPPMTLKVIVDENEVIDEARLEAARPADAAVMVAPEIAPRIVRAKETELRDMVERSEREAIRLAPTYIDRAREAAGRTLEAEIARLEALRMVNRSVRLVEIEHFTEQLAAIEHTLLSVRPRMDSVRVIVAVARRSSRGGARPG